MENSIHFFGAFRKGNVTRLTRCDSDTFFYQLLEFTCSIDADCNYGYCENGNCTCLDDYQLKEDCSLKGCEYDFWS